MDAGSIIVDQGICESVRIKDAFASRKESESTMPIEMFINVFVEAAAILSPILRGNVAHRLPKRNRKYTG